MEDKTLRESDNEEFTKKIGEVLTRFREIEFAYLFGSFLEAFSKKKLYQKKREGTNNMGVPDNGKRK